MCKYSKTSLKVFFFLKRNRKRRIQDRQFHWVLTYTLMMLEFSYSWCHLLNGINGKNDLENVLVLTAGLVRRLESILPNSGTRN